MLFRSAAAFAAAYEEDDSTPVATPMTHQDAATTVSTPAHSPEMEDEISLDGYESKFMTMLP